ncbi:MAG: PDZ domain-containing protein [Acidobacteria bacterium]|nr:PDZ domain-containing protein [Acidobacteriota bacterium]
MPPGSSPAPGTCRAVPIGIEIDEVADNDATREGAFVRAVSDDSPAESAGFAEGDVVVAFDGERVRGVRQLTRLVRETPAGRTVQATVLRGGSEVELQVTPEPSAPSMSFMPGAGGSGSGRFVGDSFPHLDDLPAPGRARLGVTVQGLSPQLAEFFGVEEGLLVSSVEAGSVASEAGVTAGDVIATVDGRAVDSAETLRRRLSGLEVGDEVTLGVTRDGRELTLTATLAEGQERRERRQRFGFFGGDDSTIE